MAGSVQVSVVRPDDLLNVAVAGVNLRLDNSDGDPVLVADDPQRESLLIVTFPPQTIVEEAFFEQPPVSPPAPVQKLGPGDVKRPDTPSGPPSPRPPGQVGYRMGEVSRLVFRVPPDSRVPYTIEGLLDWSSFTLVVPPVADVPAGGAPPPAALTIRRPSETETQLQLPFRLFLAPTHRAAWDHSTRAVTHAGRTELWHTRLVALDDDGTHRQVDALNPIGLRAVWSPDYRAGRHVPAPTDSGLPGAIAAMNTADRHQLVVLTAAFTGYAVSSRQAFTPTPINASFVMLSPLGGWLRSAGSWDPPTMAKPFPILTRGIGIGDAMRDVVLTATRVGEPVAERPKVAERAVRPPVEEIHGGFGLVRYELDPDGRLDLSQWTHTAAQGRDHYVRLVYEGRLSDLGHRASLVKVSERRFETLPGADGPVAFLRQYMYIVVREPERAYTGRNMMWKRVRLTTLVTPHIDYPYEIAGDPSYVPPGKIAGSDRSFWVTVGTQDFVFHGVAIDAAGRTVDFAKALIFVPNSETNFGSLQTATTTLAGRVRRQARIPGQQVAYAEPDPADAKDNTSFVTDTIMLGNAGATRDTFFVPNLYQADVHIPAVEALTGATTPTKLAFAQKYVDTGFGDAANATGVFAQIVTMAPDGSLAVAGSDAAFQAAQAGGFATPQLAITTLTRQLGPLGGSIADALANDFDPATVFDAGAKIFGVFGLTDLLPAGSADGNAPLMQVRRDGAAVVTELDWTSPVTKLDVGIVTFDPADGTKLTVHAEIRKDAGADATTALHGVLGRFDIELLSSLVVHFKSFTFDSQTGAKTSVDVALDDALPVEFVGDLSFVEELRKLIPPGVFGDGVSIDLIQNPLGVKAGLSIGLPPATVGVFALKNITFAADLTIPFLDGLPVAGFAFARRDAQFLLAVLIFGGGGFFHVEVDTDGLRMLEAAFEFGATAALDIGVASGEVHIMAGIYFSIQKKEIDGKDQMISELTGYLRAGGSLSVLGLVRISVEFYLSFTYYPAPLDKAKGRATLTVEVEIACFSKSVELTVERSIGGKGGDPTFEDMMPTPELWAEYAEAFA